MKHVRRQHLLQGMLLFVVLASPLHAQIYVESGGYLKAIGLRSHSIITDEPYTFLLMRLRLQEEVRVQDWLEGVLWLDNELRGGSYLETLDYRLAQDYGLRPWLHLQWRSIQGKQLSMEHRVNRGYLHVFYRAVDFYAGRQRIAWGTGFVWNPTDLMNPTDPLTIEREEKATVDALYLTVATGALSRVEFALAPQKRRSVYKWGARITTNWHTYDISLMGGYFARDWVIGGDFAGYLGDAGLRGEWTFTKAVAGESYARLVLNVDYQFTPELYGFLEGYYNGRKVEEFLGTSSLVYGTKHFYGAGFISYQVHPLIYVSLYTLANLEDKSLMMGPMIRYDILEDMDLSGGAYFFAGDIQSELGQFHAFYFGMLQFYF